MQMFTKSVGSKSDYENVTDNANIKKKKKSPESRSDYENATDNANVKKIH